MNASTERFAHLFMQRIWAGLLLWSVCYGQESDAIPHSSQSQGRASKKCAEVGVAVGASQDAAARVHKIIGVSDNSRAGSTAQLRNLAKDSTPFLNDQITGRPIWHVEVVGLMLPRASGVSNAADSRPWTFDAYVDPKDGKLLKIVSRCAGTSSKTTIEPPAEEGANQMFQSGREQYHGFPEKDPTVSFVDALEVVSKEGIGDPFSAQSITGHYVVHSRMGGERRPVWAITLRGLQPMAIPAPIPSRARALTHIRNVVDAETGQWIFAGTTPRPKGVSAKRKDP